MKPQLHHRGCGQASDQVKELHISIGMPPRGGRGGSGSSHRVGGRGRGGGNRPNSSRFQQAETGNRVARPASVSVGRGGKAAFSAPAWNLCEVPPMPYAAFVGRGSGVNDYLAEARARKDFAHEGRMALAGLDQSAVHVASTADLRVHLEALDGRQFPAYKELTGREFYFDPTGLSPGTQPRLKLRWVTIQGDPFARASAVEIYLIPQRFGWSCSDGIDSYRDESHPLSSKTRSATTRLASVRAADHSLIPTGKSRYVIFFTVVCTKTQKT